jgi:WD40 repeat protein
MASTVQVTFSTKLTDPALLLPPPTTLSIDSSLDRLGLSGMMNDLLGVEGKKCVFDFSIEVKPGEIAFLRSSLSQFLTDYKISSEDSLVIEYSLIPSHLETETIHDGESWISCFSKTQSLLAIGKMDGSVTLKDSAIAKETNMKVSDIPVTSILVLDNFLFCGLRNGKVNKFDLKNQNYRDIDLSVDNSAINCLVEINNESVLAASSSGMITVFNPSSMQSIQTSSALYVASSLNVKCVSILPGTSSIVILGGLDGYLVVYDAATNQIKKRVNVFEAVESLHCSMINEEVSHVNVIHTNSRVSVWEFSGLLSEAKCIRTYSNKDNQKGIQIDETTCVFMDKEIKIFNYKSETIINRFRVGSEEDEDEKITAALTMGEAIAVGSSTGKVYKVRILDYLKKD